MDDSTRRHINEIAVGIGLLMALASVLAAIAQFPQGRAVLGPAVPLILLLGPWYLWLIGAVVLFGLSLVLRGVTGLVSPAIIRAWRGIAHHWDSLWIHWTVGNDGWLVLNALRTGQSFTVTEYGLVEKRLSSFLSPEAILDACKYVEAIGLVTHGVADLPDPKSVVRPATGPNSMKWHLLFPSQGQVKKRSTGWERRKQEKAIAARDWLRQDGRRGLDVMSGERLRLRRKHYGTFLRCNEGLRMIGRTPVANPMQHCYIVATALGDGATELELCRREGISLRNEGELLIAATDVSDWISRYEHWHGKTLDAILAVAPSRAWRFDPLNTLERGRLHPAINAEHSLYYDVFWEKLARLEEIITAVEAQRSTDAEEVQDSRP